MSIHHLGLGGMAAAPRPSGGLGENAAADFALQQRLLAMIAQGEPLEATLTAMCLGIEQRYTGVRCTVLLVDDEAEVLRHVAAPSMDEAAVAAIDGLPVAVGAGACGTAAATDEVVVVSDALTDPLTEAFRDVATDHRLRSVWSVPLRGGQGDVLGTFALYRDATHSPTDAEVATVTVAANLGALAVERHQAHEALRAAATEDPLTGLPNRATFMAQLPEQLNHADAPVGVLFLDVDQFKLINDSLGHPAGDRLLVELGRRLQATLRPPLTVARFGGDEFTVLVPDADGAALSTAADCVDQAFADPFPIPGGKFLLTATIGMAVAQPGSDIDADELIRDADTAMYAAKAGRVGRMRFDDTMRRRVVARMALENALQRGIAGDDFEVLYQPVIAVGTGDRASVEALVRWNDPDWGAMPTEEFIELAEETGLIVPLGARVLQLAVQQIAATTAAGRAIPVAVNVSALQLSDPSFGEQVARTLAEHAVDPALLVIELTESVAVAHGTTPRRTLEKLARLGVRLLIDDFGTGYSSIPLLRELPAAGLKVDRSFTMALDEDPRMVGVIGAMIDLAHAMGLYVVAEGVDTASALTIITELGCDYAQGFHLSPPVRAADL